MPPAEARQSLTNGDSGRDHGVFSPAPSGYAASGMEPETADEDLMLRYRDGDAAAFEVLYGRYKGPLYRYLLRQCGAPSMVDELFQDVWMKLIKARSRYEVKAKIRTYLYQVARHRMIDHFRRGGKAGVSGNTEPDRLEVALASDCDGPAQQVQAMQQAENLLHLIEGLPDAQREAFLLREEAGLDLDEIAAVTGVERETAKSRLRYAMQRLRQGLKDEDS